MYVVLKISGHGPRHKSTKSLAEMDQSLTITQKLKLITEYDSRRQRREPVNQKDMREWAK